MSFYYLLLGHLFGDFVLQTDKIAENKIKYWKWNLLHSVIVTVCMLLFSIPFGYRTIELVLLSGVLHYLIDFYKSKLPVKNPLYPLIYFALDQIIHIAVIYLISIFSVKKTEILNLDIKTVKFIIILLFVSSFSSILTQLILKLFFPANNGRFFIESEKIIGIATRVFTFFALCLSFYYNKIFFISIPTIYIVIILQYRNIWHKWMIPRYFSMKLFMDLMISFIGFFLLEI